ncbi:hypothetical protein BJ742DRAFT_171692 [Cladochytrium replicatum]|nr:hypothetical protein BJ742DRAFT_171692 [Cladochytrium replicatum]
MAAIPLAGLPTVEIVIQLGIAALSLGCFLLFAVVWIRMLINVSSRRRTGTTISNFKRSATLAFSLIFVANLLHAARYVEILFFFPEDLSKSADFRPFVWKSGDFARSILSVLDLSCVVLAHFSLYIYFLLAVGRWAMYRSSLRFLSNVSRAITIATGTILYILTLSSIVIVQIHPPPYSELEMMLVMIFRSAQTAFVLVFDDTISILLCRVAFGVLDRAAPIQNASVVRQTDLRHKDGVLLSNRHGAVSESETEFTLVGTENPSIKGQHPPLPTDPFGRSETIQDNHYNRPNSYSAVGPSNYHHLHNVRSSRSLQAPSASTTPLPSIANTPSLAPSRGAPQRPHTKHSTHSLGTVPARATPILLLSALLLVDLSLIFINLAPRILPSIFEKYSAVLEFLSTTAVGVHIAICAFLMVAFSAVVGHATTHISTQPNSVQGYHLNEDEDDDEAAENIDGGTNRPQP